MSKTIKSYRFYTAESKLRRGTTTWRYSALLALRADTDSISRSCNAVKRRREVSIPSIVFHVEREISIPTAAPFGEIEYDIWKSKLLRSDNEKNAAIIILYSDKNQLLDAFVYK